ncbi:unnamed protein product [Prunus armeniaca]|uniref:Pectin acetylesterase n=1 Tax=Prunus armeniaca TaxID=36596 RepID=A0A6J5UQR1_PRUAR|nr:unnamed protein product [Prunus armeniaca]
MADAKLGQWLFLLACAVTLLKAAGVPVEITYVHSAIAKGAVCLDGSPPAYHHDKGFGSGINNWLVHIEGGGWCNNVTTCLGRKNTRLGSSKQMLKAIAFSGILSNRKMFNPDFYNWNRIKVRYCDGASFTGDVAAVNPATGLYFRGARIFRAVIEDLLAKGMGNAQNAILSGCSAGGLTSILHCDNFHALLPVGTNVKCVSDAGYFINVKDVSGAQHIEEFFSQVVETHGSARNLPPSCTSKLRPGLCFFPQYMASQIRDADILCKRSLRFMADQEHFGTGSCRSSWHLARVQARYKELLTHSTQSHARHMLDILGVTKNLPSHHLLLPKPNRTPSSSPQSCPSIYLTNPTTQTIPDGSKPPAPSGDKFQVSSDFRVQFLSVIGGMTGCPLKGMFIDSCYAHCQTETQETWLMADSPVLNKTTIAQAVGDWFYGRTPFQR